MNAQQSIVAVITDGDHIAESVRGSVEEIMPVITDGNLQSQMEDLEDSAEEMQQAGYLDIARDIRQRRWGCGHICN
jgi:hypothetical protein